MILREGRTRRRLVVSEIFSRRSLLGLAAVAVPATVLAWSNAAAQTPGMERREDRREDRQQRREDRRDDREDRRDDRQTDREERRDPTTGSNNNNNNSYDDED